MTDSTGGNRRTIPVLRALAASPGGLSTTDLALRCAPDVKPRSYAQSRIGGALRRQKAAGRVEVAGTVAGSYNNAPTFLWQITGEGESFLARRTRGRNPGRGRAGAGARVYTRSEIAGLRRTAAREIDLTRREIDLTRRKIGALAKMEAAIEELEQVEREMEAFDAASPGLNFTQDSR